MKLNTTFAAIMAALAVRPTGAVAEVYSCEIKEWVRANDEGLVQPAPSAPFKRQVSIDKETGNAVGDALSAANRWEVVQKGSHENAFVTLGYKPHESSASDEYLGIQCLQRFQSLDATRNWDRR